MRYTDKNPVGKSKIFVLSKTVPIRRFQAFGHARSSLLISFAIIGVLSLCLWGCSSESGDNAPTEAEGSSASESDHASDSDGVGDKRSGLVAMELSSDDLTQPTWTRSKVEDYLRSLGFSDIEIKEGSDPTGDNFDRDVREIYVAKGLLSSNKEWDVGDELDVSSKITMYVNPKPTLTIQSSDDFAKYAEGKGMDYLSFADEYDGYFAEFDGVVWFHSVYDGGSSHDIDVKMGDSPEGDGPSVKTDKTISTRQFDTSVEEGQRVHVVGKIDKRMSEYYKHLRVECVSMTKL